MSDVAGAPAPADSAPAPVAEVAVSTPNPISSEPVAAEPKAEVKTEAKEPTPREALMRAAAKVEATDKADKGKEPAPVKDAGPTRDETGKFLPKDGMPKPAMPADQPITKGQIDTFAKPAASASDAPARFSPEAKAAWSTAPDPVKAEVHRALKETEAGIEKYKASADAFEPVRRFHERATQGGTTLEKALTAYVGLEDTWRQDPVRGFIGICQNQGVDALQQAKAIYERLSGAQGLPRGDSPEIADLKRQLSEVKQQVGGITTSTKEREIQAHITQWAADKPRFEELADNIAKLISTGYASSLDEAYSMADRLTPGAAPQPVPPKGLEPDLRAQTLKGSKSVAGAPNSGSNPAKRPPSSSIKDAVKRAMAQAG